MKKRITYIFILILLILIVILIYNFSNSNYLNNNPEVCILKVCFNIEIVKTQEERAKGLMYRTFLPQDKGMLFIFSEEGIYPFWMKNTLIPLDIIWISSENKIVYINHNTPPCTLEPCASYSPNKNALYVLEINAGLAEKHNFKEEDNIILNYIN